jgi:hypothetical protein|nr:hypothetical protein [Kofleriaceae bacterium]
MTAGWGALATGVIVAVFFTASKIGAYRARRRYRVTQADGLGSLPEVDGWHVVDEAAYRFYSASEPPRAWSVGRQLARDVRSPVAIAFWLLATAGTATALALQIPALLGLCLPAAGILGFTIPASIRERRAGRVTVLAVDRLDDPAMFSRAYAYPAAATTAVPRAHALKLLVPWTQVRALIDRHGAAEVLVLTQGTSGTALAVRPPRDQAARARNIGANAAR